MDDSSDVAQVAVRLSRIENKPGTVGCKYAVGRNVKFARAIQHLRAIPLVCLEVVDLDATNACLVECKITPARCLEKRPGRVCHSTSWSECAWIKCKTPAKLN